MIGRLDSNHKQATVVGAGIAGLLIADALDRAGYQVTLLEKSGRAGGLIETKETPFGLAESAAHSLLVTPKAHELFDRLGVELLPVNENSRARYILRAGRMRKMPLGPLEAFGAFLRAYFVVSKSPEVQTLEQWADRHLGQAAREYLMTPFVRGIYGALPSALELELAFPSLKLPRGHSLLSYQLHRWRKRKGPKPARPKMMAPAKGVGALVDALTESLRQRLGDRFKLNQNIGPEEFSRLSSLPNLILAVPADEAARLLENASRLVGGQAAVTAQALKKVAYTPIISVTVFVKTGEFNGRPPRGVGVLVPARETQSRVLGVLFNSSAFAGRAKQDVESFTVMLGGEHLERSDEDIQSLIKEELSAIFHTPLTLAHTVIHRWSRAIPRYDHTLGEALNVARSGWCAKPGHLIFGNYTGQVSLRGMIDLVNQTEWLSP